ncbi:Lrp/AsnC family transcriptional regulator [Litoreibacter albidus]|uniref:DNA-binding transcriptional regulator, Lrp family n=1 Tax=Litoreibacter albidus TaxID=670155 RepID=A0A1H3C9R7_9RHOB|nr:Lrp/AsnC family transcriptional regulator [Litoreibacter albidus]SDX50853.1 DNA-binding transcriptional regulator, Lrp family [Litoreibacter albidus]
MIIDDTDKKILRLLQKDARLSTKDVAAAVNMSISPCWRRIKRLEDAGLIEDYVAVLDRKKLGLGALAYVHVSLLDHTTASIEAFDRLVQSDDEITECSAITGDSDYVLKIVAQDPEDLERYLMQRLLGSGLVRSSNTNFVLRNTKSRGALPVI